MQIGISAHQKLEKLLAIVRLIGYQALPVFGDCFDEVTYLDPVLYPEAMKQFASSVRLASLCELSASHALGGPAQVMRCASAVCRHVNFLFGACAACMTCAHPPAWSRIWYAGFGGQTAIFELECCAIPSEACVATTTPEP